MAANMSRRTLLGGRLFNVGQRSFSEAEASSPLLRSVFSFVLNENAALSNSFSPSALRSYACRSSPIIPTTRPHSARISPAYSNSPISVLVMSGNSSVRYSSSSKPPSDGESGSGETRPPRPTIESLKALKVMEDEFEQMKLEIQRLKEDALKQQSEWDEKEAIRKETIRQQMEEEEKLAQQEMRLAAEQAAKRAAEKEAIEEEARQATEAKLLLAAEEEKERAREAEEQQMIEAIRSLEEELGSGAEEGGLPPLTEILNEDILAQEKKARREHEARLQMKDYEQKIDENGISFGLGRRKSSTAQVWIRMIEDIADTEYPEYSFMVNGKEVYEYFPMLNHRQRILEPFVVSGTLGFFHAEVKVTGGGSTGQADAIRLGLARALQNYEPSLRPELKANGMMTRDPRMVERKKPGRPKARKSFQWVKR